MEKKIQYNNNTFALFVCTICFLTNISQMPYMVEHSYTRYMALPLWLLFALVCVIKNPKLNITNVKKYLAVVACFFIYYIIALVRNYSYSDSALPYPIFLSTFILIIGLMAGQFLTYDDYYAMGTSYVISSLIVCVDIFLKYIYGNNLSALTYLYESKNSVSQIFLTAWIIILLLKFGKARGFFKTMFYIVSFCFLTWVMLTLKSRATIIGMPIVLSWVLLHGRVNKKIRNLVLVLITVVVVFLLIDHNAYTFLMDNIIFAGRANSSIDIISSGRTIQWNKFGSEFADAWLLGHGARARESLILTSLLEYGVLGGSLIFIMAIWPFVWGIRHLYKKNVMYLFFTSIALVYVTNGIFEQLAPFGPGVKCYFLWFLFGALANTDFIKSKIGILEEKEIGYGYKETGVNKRNNPCL